MKKKILAAFAVAAILSLSACSGGNQTSGTSSTPAESSAVSTEASDSASKASETPSDASKAEGDSLLKTTLDKVRSEVTLPKEMTDFTAKRIKRTLGIEEDQMADYAGTICSDGLKQEQIIYIKAKDEDAAADIEKKLQDNLQATYNAIKNYDQDQVEMIEKAKVLREGLYVSLVISPDDEKIRSIFTAAINP